METPIEQIHSSLQKLIGHHRQLLEVVRIEHRALVDADLKAIQEVTLAKQGVIELIRQSETERMKILSQLAVLWKKPLRDLTLNAVAIAIQGHDPKMADQLRSAYNALTILVKRIAEQNDSNRVLVNKSLEHINQMKSNILGEAVPKASTYTQQGTKAGGRANSRLISKEA